jgi:hypothetical protein
MILHAYTEQRQREMSAAASCAAGYSADALETLTAAIEEYKDEKVPLGLALAVTLAHQQVAQAAKFGERAYYAINR